MRRCDRSIRGQSLVEFALVLPMFLLLLIGVTEFGRAWMTRNILTGASREAVRIAAVQGNAASALSRANNVLSSAGISGASVNIADDGAPYGTCRVTVSYAFPVSVAGFLSPSTGIVDSHGLMLALQGEAEAHGAVALDEDHRLLAALMDLHQPLVDLRQQRHLVIAGLRHAQLQGDLPEEPFRRDGRVDDHQELDRVR